MRKIVETTFVSLDGVITSPENWVARYWDDEFDKYAHDLLLAADALLLGRETYEGFVQSWSTRTGVYAERINSLPKFVASKTLSEPLEWNATLIQGDVGEEVARLKDQPGENILKFGTGELDRTLIEQNLVDKFHLWMHPVAVGGGQRIFDGFDTTHMTLVETTRFDSGVVVLVYAPTATGSRGGTKLWRRSSAG
jgi:dihydrofolate reductase